MRNSTIEERLAQLEQENCKLRRWAHIGGFTTFAMLVVIGFVGANSADNGVEDVVKAKRFELVKGGSTVAVLSHDGGQPTLRLNGGTRYTKLTDGSLGLYEVSKPTDILRASLTNAQPTDPNYYTGLSITGPDGMVALSVKKKDGPEARLSVPRAKATPKPVEATSAEELKWYNAIVQIGTIKNGEDAKILFRDRKTQKVVFVLSAPK